MLFKDTYDWSAVLGVYSTRERAELAAAASTQGGLIVEERMVDDVAVDPFDALPPVVAKES